ncbi:MAG TPA: hypothetical protein VKG80_15490 [Trebonia sp.]|nr:hypothetical protein [Trebonia sp.]
MRTAGLLGLIALMGLFGTAPPAAEAAHVTVIPAVARVTAAAPPANELFGVSCASPKNCVAVGLDGNAYRGTGGPLAEKWNGRAWQIARMRLPAGAISGELFGVSCKSASACVAVGLYLDSAGAGIPLAETWNGRTWTPRTLPTPARGTGVILNGVSCVSARRCVAVGEYFTGGGAAAVAESWNGSRWTAATPPAPADSVEGDLSAVSCPSAAYCVAVGKSATTAGSSVLIDSWNGRTWREMAAQPPGGLEHAELNGVWCTSAANCVAVGLGSGGSGLTGFTELWNGSAWRSARVSWPRGAANSGLVGVSCASAKRCVMVGYLDMNPGAGGNTGRAAAVTWNGRTWTVTRVPAPARGKASLFNGVSCLSAVNCVAAGQVGPENSSSGTGLSGFWNGRGWRLVTAL